MEWLNPIEWLAWVYGKVFQQHALFGGFVVVFIFAAFGFVLWIRAIDKFNEEHAKPKGEAVASGGRQPDPEPVFQPHAPTPQEHPTPESTQRKAAQKHVASKATPRSAPIATTSPQPFKPEDFVGVSIGDGKAGQGNTGIDASHMNTANIHDAKIAGYQTGIRLNDVGGGEIANVTISGNPNSPTDAQLNASIKRTNAIWISLLAGLERDAGNSKQLQVDLRTAKAQLEPEWALLVDDPRWLRTAHKTFDDLEAAIVAAGDNKEVVLKIVQPQLNGLQKSTQQ
jgi:hypothetical protein